MPLVIVCGRECHPSGSFWVCRNNEREECWWFQKLYNYRAPHTKIHLLSFPRRQWPWSSLSWSAFLFSFTSLVSIKIGFLRYINTMKCEYYVIIILIKTKSRFNLILLFNIHHVTLTCHVWDTQCLFNIWMVTFVSLKFAFLKIHTW